MITIQGKGVSAGVGVGPLYFYRRATAEIKRYTVEDTDAEWHRFKGAQTGAIEQLGVLAEQARKEAGDEAAMLFETHQMMAEDLDYEEAIEDRIVNQKMNAEAAVSDTSEQFAEMFASMDDAYMQARAADVKDVSQRILGILCGIVQGGIASDVPVLLCADDLAPSETIQLDKSKVLGFITAGGSAHHLPHGHSGPHAGYSRHRRHGRRAQARAGGPRRHRGRQHRCAGHRPRRRYP